jgi:tripartite-type tricarboxylate transporter receptor subunit TctC
MQVPRLIEPGFTLGAALSNNTQERPSALLPVTTRRIGLGSAIAIHFNLPRDGFMQNLHRQIAYTIHRDPRISKGAMKSGWQVEGILRQLRPILFAIGLAFTVANPVAAQAQSFPNRPIRIIVGPSPDIFSRIIAEHLQEAWGQPVVVEPRPGAGGKLAVTSVSTAAADGHTLLFATPTYTLNTAMKVASYDLLNEFAPVSMIGVISYVLVIHSSVPANSLAGLVAYAKQNPGRLNCASAGIGTVPHLACEYLNHIAGTNILHVPYRDVNSATMATIGNVTQMFFGVSTSAKSQIDSHTLRGLAVSTAQRSLLLPDLPTMIESGYPTFDMPGWGGLFAPARTPIDILEKLNREVRHAVERPDLQKRLLTVGMEPPPSQTPSEFRTFVASDIARWMQFVDAVGADRLTGETPQQ